MTSNKPESSTETFLPTERVTVIRPDDSEYTWRVGEAVKVHSKGKGDWCPGEIKKIEVPKSRDEPPQAEVQYWSDTQLKSKWIPLTIEDVQPVEHITETRSEWKKGSIVEIWSNSSKRWFKAAVTEVISATDQSDADQLVLAWNVTKLDNQVMRMTKEASRASPSLRHLYEAPQTQTSKEDTRGSDEKKESDKEVKFGLDTLMGACLDLVRRSNLIVKTVYEGGDLGVIDKAYGDKKLSKEEELKAEDPTTKADLMAQKLIAGSLRNLFPDLTVCGEEGKLEYSKDDIVTPDVTFNDEIPQPYQDLDIQHVTVWVDPVDGTKEFTEGIKEAVTTLVGIAYKGRPIAGVIGRPFSEQIVWGIVGLGAFGYSDTIPLANRDKRRRIICTTRSHFKPAMRGYVGACNPSGFVRAGGSGGKVLMVIEGAADAYVFPSLGTKKWDTCGPEAILVALGGKLTRPDGTYYDYSKDAPFMNQEGFIATVFGDEYHSTFLRENIKIEQLDLILYGATGFTGTLAVEHIIETYGNSDFAFGIAGRNRRKLEAVQDKMRSIDEDAANRLTLVVCDSSSDAEMEAMARKTAVVVTTVGPFARYGESLIRACCKYGVDYVDITGEYFWVKAMIDRYEDEAIRSSARITSFAAMVSFPVDTTLFMGAQYLRDKHGFDPRNDDLVVTPYMLIKNSTPSGGTLESSFASFDTLDKVDQSDTYLMLPPDQKGPKQPSPSLPGYNKRFEKYEHAGFYGVVDRPVVCRSNAIMGYPYGKKMRLEFTRWLSKSFVFVWVFTILLGFISVMLRFRLGRYILKLFRRFLPSPGQGPSRENMLKGAFTLWTNIQTKRSNKEIEVQFKMHGDPGYLNTSKIAVEHGMVFATQRRNPKLRKIKGGFMTPASAVGEAAMERLVKLKNFEFNIEDLSQ